MADPGAEAGEGAEPFLPMQAPLARGADAAEGQGGEADMLDAALGQAI